jgi:DNA-binding XRE family transcriptional regulator
MIHIATNKTYRAGIEHEPSLCEFCGHKDVWISWVDLSCDTCGNTYESTIGNSLMMMRHKLGLTRKELGKILGYKTSTIKSYEWKIPSKVYIEIFKKLIRKNYKKEVKNEFKY